MATSEELARTCCPDMPSDRKVVSTMNQEMWYTIDPVEKILYVPNSKHLYFNPMELESFMEAVNNFSKLEDFETQFDWEHLDEESYGDEGNAVLFLKALRELHPPLVACDIETRQLHWEDNRLLAIGFCWENNTVRSVTVFTPAVIRELQKLFNCTDIKFLWHNGKFDTSRLKYFKDTKISARVDEDTMLMHFIGINEKKGTHSLKHLGRLYLQAPAWEDELDKYKREWCRKNKKLLKDFRYDDIPIEILLPYLHRDCVATFRLYHVFKPLMRENSQFLYRQLIRASNVFRELELNGVLLDQEYVSNLEKEMTGQLEELQEHLKEAVDVLWDVEQYMKDTGAKSRPEEFKISSPKQLKWILETATGKKLASTDREAVDKLVEEYEHQPDSPAKKLITSIGDVRKLSKYIDTYITAMQKVMCGDGRIRCEYKLHGTETGRLSCAEPNMQNIPRNKKIKNIFKATEGSVLVQFDYSQAELRTLAALSGDKWLTQVYLDDKDLHAAVAERIFGPGFTKEQRNQAKTVSE